MAQPAGYSNDGQPSAGLIDHLENSRFMVNGQPPQFNKMATYAGAKTVRTPFVGQQTLNSSGTITSNGPPIAQNHSHPGSLSSHSSRNASPTPPVRHNAVSQSMENLSQSTPVQSSRPSQHGNTMSMSSIPQHQLPNESMIRKTMTGNNQPNVNIGSVVTNSQHGAIGNQHFQGQKNPAEPSKTVSFPYNSHQSSQNLSQNIPSQGVSENQYDILGNSRISAPAPINSMQHSPLSSSASQVSQMHTLPLASSQASFNGPANAYSQHKNPYLSHSGTLPPIPPSNTPSQQGHFPNVRTSGNSADNSSSYVQSNTKTSASQFGQNQGSSSPLLKNATVQYGSTNPGVMKSTGPPLNQSHPYHGPSTGSIRGTGPFPVPQHSGLPPGSNVRPSFLAGPGQIPGNQMSQPTNVPPVSHDGPKQLSHPVQTPSASGPNLPSNNNRTLQPSMPLTGAPGFNQPPSNTLYPGMPPTSASGLKPMPFNQMSHPMVAGQQYSNIPSTISGPNPPSTQPVQYTSMPPPVIPSGPGQPPPSSHPSHYPGVSNQPVQSQAVASGMPPTSQYPGMPPLPASGYSQPAMPPPPSNSGSGDHYHPSRRYPQQPGYQMQTQPGIDGLTGQMSNLSVTQAGFNKLWGLEYYDLLQTRNILPPEKVEPPKIALHQEFLDNVNCSHEIFRCTLTKIPESNSLLQKARLPLGILIHPFKDLNHLPVIQCSTIVRCRACRTYINPFVYFVDQKRWKCNLCFRVNELPEEFQYDPVSKTYGDPTRRPEIKSSTMEFIAPSEYMLRPPQPAVYLFLLDVSQLGVESGYLQLVCEILLDELDKLPGDGRTQIGIITYDTNVHFYNLAEGLSQPQQMIVVDTEEIFLPCPDNLLVNLAESRDLIRDLLTHLPIKFQTSHDGNSALGPALQAAFKLMSPTGGRVTVFQACLPTKGPGALTAREDPSQRAGKEAPHLNPAIDFYKRLALDCSGQQVAVDLFVINSQYCDLATISGVSRFSGGCIHHFPLFKISNTLQVENFERVFRRYLNRKIGFEAVMRIRCSRGLGIHTFHGNFFVRSTDLLSLPNVNPDAGFGMQVSIEESLAELQNVCFQAALLYTTSKGERRIRVHTLCLPVATTLPDILQSADQQCIVGLLAKMAVDRSLQTSLSDAREAFINVAIDVMSAYRLVQSSGAATGLLAPHNLRLLPMYILALLKYVAFRSGQSTRLDDRVFSMCQMKTLPLTNLIQNIYPDMYPVHCLEEQLVVLEDGTSLPQPPRLHLSAEKLDQRGVFLMDTGELMLLYVGRNVSAEYCTDVFGVPSFSQIPEEMYELPVLENTRSENLRSFITYLQSEKPYSATIQVIRDDGHHRSKFIERLIEDRTESAFSYYEFLQHLKTNVK